MGKQSNKLIGKLGEDLAADYLQKQGYEILARNWGNKWGEIDIVCRKRVEPFGLQRVPPLVFVEVKTKTSTAFGQPWQMVNPRKLFQIKRVAALFPAGINQPKRIDVISVVLTRDRKLQTLNHYQAVY